MGNIECCRPKIDIEAIESEEEIYIREIIGYFTHKMVANAKLIKLMQKCFSIILLDIEGPPLDWISEQSYYEFIYRIFEKSGEEKKLKYIILEYNKVRNISLKDYYENNFHLLLSIWLVGIAPSKTISDEEKINMIKTIIIKCNKYITYKTFSKFLNTFLEMMLIEITFNFHRHNEDDTKSLLNDIYNNAHVNEFWKWLCWKMGNIITNNKKIDLTDTKAINNEFIKDDHLIAFFKQNSFLLRPIELRKNFYNKYK
jgi:hypothetical protein